MTIKTLLLDVGGVLLTNGFDRKLRKKIATDYNIDFEKIEARHKEVVEDFEIGSISFDDYIKHLFFFQTRPFSVKDVKDSILSSVQPDRAMIDFCTNYKQKANVRIILFSNEGAEIAQDRFQRFPEIVGFVDFYIVSGFIGLRKPDLRIYKLALGLVQQDPAHIMYIDDRQANLEPAKALGMGTLCHKDFQTTLSSLKEFSEVTYVTQNLVSDF